MNSIGLASASGVENVKCALVGDAQAGKTSLYSLWLGDDDDVNHQRASSGEESANEVVNSEVFDSLQAVERDYRKVRESLAALVRLGGQRSAHSDILRATEGREEPVCLRQEVEQVAATAATVTGFAKRVFPPSEECRARVAAIQALQDQIAETRQAIGSLVKLALREENNTTTTTTSNNNNNSSSSSRESKGVKAMWSGRNRTSGTNGSDSFLSPSTGMLDLTMSLWDTSEKKEIAGTRGSIGGDVVVADTGAVELPDPSYLHLVDALVFVVSLRGVNLHEEGPHEEHKALSDRLASWFSKANETAYSCNALWFVIGSQYDRSAVTCNSAARRSGALPPAPTDEEMSTFMKRIVQPAAKKAEIGFWKGSPSSQGLETDELSERPPFLGGVYFTTVASSSSWAAEGGKRRSRMPAWLLQSAPPPEGSQALNHVLEAAVRLEDFYEAVSVYWFYVTSVSHCMTNVGQETASYRAKYPSRPTRKKAAVKQHSTLFLLNTSVPIRYGIVCALLYTVYIFIVHRAVVNTCAVLALPFQRLLGLEGGVTLDNI